MTFNLCISAYNCDMENFLDKNHFQRIFVLHLLQESYYYIMVGVHKRDSHRKLSICILSTVTWTSIPYVQLTSHFDILQTLPCLLSPHEIMY
jgi:hypothetical protein